jgi:hypothetical protein
MSDNLEMTAADLNREMIAHLQAWAESDEEYPVEFDKSWRWLGYSQKGHAKVSLTKKFVVNKDYQFREIETAAGGTKRQEIKLSKLCFEQFCLSAPTAQGQRIRGIYIDIKNKHMALRAAIERGDIELRVTSSQPNSGGYLDERHEARAQSIDEYNEKVAAIKQNAALNRDVLIKTNAEISRASLGMYPREFRHLRNLNRHVSARDFMDTAQLHSVALGEIATKNMAGEQSQTAADFNQKILTMTQRLFDFNKDYGIHGDKNMPRLMAPQRLDEIAAAPTPLALTQVSA